jgi:Fe-S cluster biogenesis protein NfuA
MVDVTLKQGVEVLIKEGVPEVEEILDVTEHADGSNPYYQPSK